MFKSFFLGLSALLLTACAQAFDSRYIGSAKEYIRISNEPCTSAFVKKNANPQVVSRLLNAEYVAQGKPSVKGCYITHEGINYFLFEDGDSVGLPDEAFSSVLKADPKHQSVDGQRY